MSEPLITVVVPIYNVERYLDECIESIVGQTYKNLEILLIDDGSTDLCPAICDEWARKDQRIRVIHKQNQGLGMARNTGIDGANGEYICFTDSDDYIDIHTVEKAYRKAQYYNAEIVIYGIADFDDNNTDVTVHIPVVASNLYEGSRVQTDLLPDLIDCDHVNSKSENLPFSACSCLFSMKLIKSNNWRFVSERNIISEDSYSLLKLYRHVTRVYVINETLYFYRRNARSLSRTYRTDRYDKTKSFYIKAEEVAVESGYSDKVQERISGLFYSFTIDCLKQIITAQNTYNVKMKAIKHIVFDEILRNCLKRCRYGKRKKAKAILKHAILARNTLAVYLLVYLKTR